MFGRKLEVKVVKDEKSVTNDEAIKKEVMKQVAFEEYCKTATRGVVSVAVAHAALKTFHDVAVEVAKKAPITVYMK